MATRLSWNKAREAVAALKKDSMTKLGACDGPAADMWWPGLPCPNRCGGRTPKYWAVTVSGTLTEKSTPAPGAECVCQGSAFYLPELYVVEQRTENFQTCLYDCVPCPMRSHPDEAPNNGPGAFNNYWGGMDGVLLDAVYFDLSIGLVRLYKGDAIGAFRSPDPDWSSKTWDCRSTGWDFPWLMDEAGACDWSGISVNVSSHVGTHPAYPCTWCGCRDQASEPAYWSLDLAGDSVNGECSTCDEMQKYFLMWACENAARYGSSTFQDVCQTLQGEDLCYPTPEGPECIYRSTGTVGFTRGGCMHTLDSVLYSGPTFYEPNPDPCSWILVNSEQIPVSVDLDCSTISRQGTLGPKGPPTCRWGCDHEGMNWALNAIGGAAAYSQGIWKPRKKQILLPAGIPEKPCTNCGYDASSDPDFPQDLL